MLQKAENSWTGEKTTRRRRRSRWPWLLAALLMAGGGYYYFAGAQAPEEAAVFQTAVVARGDIETSVNAIAKMQPKTYVDVGTQVSGQLRTIHPDVGSVVKKGDLLAEIDPTVYQTRVAGDRASLDNLRAQLAQAEAQLTLDKLRNERAQQLLKNQSGSKDAADAAMPRTKRQPAPPRGRRNRATPSRKGPRTATAAYPSTPSRARARA